jgi:hypothetical protein
MATLRRVDGSHDYGTRSARSGLVVGSGNHRLVAYKVPAEWHALIEEQRGIRSVRASSGVPRGTFWCSMSCFSVGCWDVGCVGSAVRGMGTLRVRGRVC